MTNMKLTGIHSARQPKIPDEEHNNVLRALKIVQAGGEAKLNRSSQLSLQLEV